MARQGPDAQEVWADGHVGFMHAMLRTTWESEEERQPLSLDEQVWITADARIDGRDELIRKLSGKSHRDFSGADDAELILRAYQAWGESCLEHLIGDFSFAVWDGPQRRLFCARDQFGVKPFYYAHLAGSLVFSNSLNCVRLHPGVGDRLNDLAVADFLIFGANQEHGTTAFADVRRLPPAHTLKWEAGALSLSRYWTLPDNGQIRYRRAGDYVEHFREELRVAVGDRLRTNKVGVFMSGGLDSPAIAAVAKAVLSRGASSLDLRAYAIVYDKLIPDEERYYSQLAAEHLGIPIKHLAADDYALYEGWDNPELHTPEPNDDPMLAHNYDLKRAAASNCRVTLTGLGGDAILMHSPSYVSSMLRKLRLINIASGTLRYILMYRAVPPLGLRKFIRERFKGKPPRWRPAYPEWINKEFEQRLGLRARWEELTKYDQPSGHRLRPEAYQQFAPSSPFWSMLFESTDPGVTHLPLEFRHPFFDTRLVKFLLELPPLPWFVNKALLRIAMRNILPEAVRVRPKTALVGNPLELNLLRAEKGLYEGFEPATRLDRYVDVSLLPDSTRRAEPGQAWLVARPYSLNFWLRQMGA